MMARSLCSAVLLFALAALERACGNVFTLTDRYTAGADVIALTPRCHILTT